MSINSDELKKIIRNSLGQKTKGKTRNKLHEAFVVAAQVYDLKTDLLSEKTKIAHQELFENYVGSLNKISAKLDSADKSESNPNDSEFRSLKIDETYNLNAAFLHAYYFDNIADPNSKITMDSLAYMRLARDFGTFENWQKDFIATAMASRNGWAVTVYNGFLDRFMNVTIDLHSLNVPMFAYPVIVLDCWEHSYYRDYLNDRKKYVFAMMKQLNWERIEQRVKKADMISKVVTKPLN